MIVSRAKNQKAAKEAVIEYLQKFHNGDMSKVQEYERFIKFFGSKMIYRAQSNDCYFIDFLEDLERLND